MKLTDLDYSEASWIEHEPPSCVFAVDLEDHVPSVSEYANAVLALTVEKGGRGGTAPVGRFWVVYLYKGDVGQDIRPDEIITFHVKYSSMDEVDAVDKYLGGFLFGAENAPPLGSAQGWNANSDPRNKAAGERLMSGLASARTDPPEENRRNGGCFIATAAYGSPMACEVQVLRDYRDRVLACSSLGQAFIRLYGQFGPHLARLINKSDTAREIVRIIVVKPVLRLARRCLR